MAEIKVVWNLTEPLPNLRLNEKVVVKAVRKNQIVEVGKILVITWGGFIKDPETTVKWVGSKAELGREQPFIAYLDDSPVGTVCPLLDRESQSGRLDGGVHVLPEHRRQYIGTTLLMTALKWLKDHGMREAWVTPWNAEGEGAIERATVFYVSSGGTIREE